MFAIATHTRFGTVTAEAASVRELACMVRAYGALSGHNASSNNAYVGGPDVTFTTWKDDGSDEPDTLEVTVPAAQWPDVFPLLYRAA